jgi:osmotically-inducible protein OsmY
MGCSTRPNDAAIVSQVQSKIAADSGLAGKAVTVQSNDGVVTLTGGVDNEQQRTAAAMHAGTVEGVRS